MKAQTRIENVAAAIFESRTAFRTKAVSRRSIVFAALLMLVFSANAFAGSGKKSVKKGKAKSTSAASKKAPAANVKDTLLSLATKLGVSADQIEMVRYAIAQPAYFGTVAEHATAQDYPFFALIGAAKAARRVTKYNDSKYQFTQKTCNLPYVALDYIFARADGYIDQAKDSDKTKNISSVGKEFAANYAKAQTQAAKDEIIAQLAANIPYFRDIPVICSFAFETNFTIERQIEQLITEKVKKIRETYTALNNGNYIEAVKLLGQIGASEEIACDFIADSVSAGLITKLPILGDLATGACKTVAGKLLAYAEKAAEALGCTVRSLVPFVDNCSTAPKGPPDPRVLAQIYAAQHCSTMQTKISGFIKGTETFRPAKVKYVLNMPRRSAAGGPPEFNYSYGCDNETYCESLTGNLSCSTFEDREKIRMANEQRLKLDLQKRLPVDMANFNKKWMPLCPFDDAGCKNDIAGVSNAYETAIKKLANQVPASYYSTIYAGFNSAYEAAAAQKIWASEYRLLPLVWSKTFTDEWDWQCKGTPSCLARMKDIRTSVLAGVNAVGKKWILPPYSSTSPVYAAGEKAAMEYFAKEFKGEKKDGDAVFREQVTRVIMDALGREPNFIEAGDLLLLRNGKETEQSLYQKKVAEMNKNPKERAAMIERAYQAAMGRNARPGDLQYWQPRSESFKELVAAARAYLHSPGGTSDLKETIDRAIKAGQRRPSDVSTFTKVITSRKQIYIEILKQLER